MGAPAAALVGHNWGSLIALGAAARLQERASHLAGGHGLPDEGVARAAGGLANEPEKALAMVNVFSRSTLCAPPTALGPRHLAVRRQHGLMPPCCAATPT